MAAITFPGTSYVPEFPLLADLSSMQRELEKVQEEEQARVKGSDREADLSLFINSEIAKAGEILVAMGQSGTSTLEMRAWLKDTIAELRYGVAQALQPVDRTASVATRNRILDEIHQSTLPPRSSGDELIADLAQGRVASRVSELYGRWPARTLRVGGNTVRRDGPPSENPLRDRFLSALSRVTLVEAVGLVVKRVPAYVAVAGAHAVGAFAEETQPQLARLAQHPDVAELDRLLAPGPSIPFARDYFTASEAIKIAQATLKLLQLPSDGFHAAHDALSNAASSLCDRLGITEENARKVAKFLEENEALFAADASTF
jgi:hypothetical protein